MARRKQNTQYPRDRKRLVVDFERRIRYDEEEGSDLNVLRCPNSIAWVVHPLADETELLAKLEMQPSECRSADAYWRYRDSAYFVQFVGCDREWARYLQPWGIRYRFDKEYRRDDFIIALPCPAIHTTHLLTTFARLEALIDQGRIETARRRLRPEGGRTRWLGPVYLGEVPGLPPAE